MNRAMPDDFLFGNVPLCENAQISIAVLEFPRVGRPFRFQLPSRTFERCGLREEYRQGRCGK